MLFFKKVKPKTAVVQHIYTNVATKSTIKIANIKFLFLNKYSYNTNINKVTGLLEGESPQVFLNFQNSKLN